MKHFADQIYINGKVYTVDDARPVCSAFCLRGDRFLDVGTDEEMLKYRSPETAVVDLKGKTVLPGLIDSHLHVHNTGAMRMELDVREKSKDDIAALVKAAAEKAGPDEWVIGRGWLQSDWGETAFPSKELLDAVAPDVPVYLKRACGHASWANSKAFALAGIGEDDPNPPGGEIMRKEDGTILGVVTDQVQEAFNKAIPPYRKEQLQKIALLAQEEFLAYGLTSVHDAGTQQEVLDSWCELYEKGDMKLRIYAMMRPFGRPTYDVLMETSRRFFKNGLIIGKYDNRLTARSYKISGDGSLGGWSAWMLEPYSDRPGFASDGKWTDDELYQVFYEARLAGFQIMYHAIGDAANRQCLDTYERVLRELPDADHRLRIEHAQILAPDDIPRFKQLGVIPTHQTVFLRTDKKVADARLGDRVKGAYAWRTLIDEGNIVPNGTDSPVEGANPFVSMYCAVSRKDEFGEPAGGWYPEEAMTREEMLKSYTIWGAYAAFEENLKGSITPSKLADFVVIDRDIMTCPEDEIKNIGVLETVIGGECVYKK